ncbi:AhpC/TSA family protein [Caulobacter segnis]|uniref:thioredoxin-dependent peroxiredoxin n=2 Tax=Caulobacter segnis TaxID=88688 RepID=D5VGP5_CAUST|nr:peroxiredoxin-like family protein [Caulobacter segnis]ADG10488.1 alkyl hydroperoxide reductase/ Thiol specific antioxidant/ Mal allergen [Caulobacter segnis ATCC 21756]AVQ02212.1 AhpC/TSA family protein [Caulobacter segnis]
MSKSLKERLADLHAERERTWDPAALKINVDQRRTLVETADPTRWVQVGQRLAPFVLKDVEGGDLSLERLLERGPAVLVFFRFAGCPACNIALPYYEERLAPALRDLGATLVAVSPQVPERLVDIKVRHGLSFKVASDLGNDLSRQFGVLYTADEASQAAQRAKGAFIGETTGTGTWELPQPAVVVIDHERVVRFVDVSPDWLVRTEAEPVLEAVRDITLVPAE